MNNFRIEGDSLDNIRIKIEKAISEEKLKAIMLKAGKILLKKALDLVPVDSGNLKDSLSIEYEFKKNGGSITIKAGNEEVDYAPYVEYGCITIKTGTPNSPAKIKHGYSPFIRPALLEAIRYINKELTKLFEEL